MEGRAAECSLAGSMVSDDVLEGLVRDGVNRSGVGKKEMKKEKRL